MADRSRVGIPHVSASVTTSPGFELPPARGILRLRDLNSVHDPHTPALRNKFEDRRAQLNSKGSAFESLSGRHYPLSPWC